jgi:outer membrane biogenesis lipoprotein LolB
MIAQVTFAPWGKPDSSLTWGNLQVTLQYVNYWQFNGQSKGASDNNTFYVNFWWAFGLNHFF